MNKTKLMAIFLFSILLCGCSEKSLGCTKVEDNDSGKMTEEQYFDFSGNNIKTYKANMSIKLNDDFDDYADMLLEKLKEPFKEYDDKNGIKYKTNQKDGTISVSISADYNKLDDETKNRLGIKDSNYDEVKKTLEEDGYTCK